MRTYDLLQTATGKTKSGVAEDMVMELVLRDKLKPDDQLRVTGHNTWHAVSKVREQFEKLAAQKKADAATGAEAVDADATVGPPPRPVPEAESPAPEAAAAPPVRVKPTPVKPKRKAPPEEAEHHALKRSVETEEYDLTPMVDMAFLLNMFFMMTTAYTLLHSIQIPPPLPEDASKESKTQTVDPNESNMIVVSIDQDNKFRVDDEDANFDNLREKIQKQMNETKAHILIKAHGDAVHESLVHIFDIANSIGIKNISLARLRPGE
jgi:biopolymer transport protein ExbD